MLLKSWAIPPVSWPTASIFWTWRSVASWTRNSAVAASTASVSSAARWRSLSASARANSPSVRVWSVNQPSEMMPPTSSTPNTASTPAMRLDRSTDSAATAARCSSNCRSRAMMRSSSVLMRMSAGALRDW